MPILATSIQLQQFQMGLNYLASLPTPPHCLSNDYSKQKQEISCICIITQIIIFKSCKKNVLISLQNKPAKKKIPVRRGGVCSQRALGFLTSPSQELEFDCGGVVRTGGCQLKICSGLSVRAAL